ncbi:MAG: hypothetical protein ACYC59_06485 [Anaerolineaceae bacterium]
MENSRFRNELEQLFRLKNLLDEDRVLPIRFDVNRKSLDFHWFEIVIHGLDSPIINNIKPKVIKDFFIDFTIPPGYPWDSLPHLIFIKNIPFHPNIYTSGNICWGDLGYSSQPDLHLVDWFGLSIDLLQFTQEKEGFIVLNSGSPANVSASTWWNGNKFRINQLITKIDIVRLRFWIDKSRV